MKWLKKAAITSIIISALFAIFMISAEATTLDSTYKWFYLYSYKSGLSFPSYSIRNENIPLRIETATDGASIPEKGTPISFTASIDALFSKVEIQKITWYVNGKAVQTSTVSTMQTATSNFTTNYDGPMAVSCAFDGLLSYSLDESTYSGSFTNLATKMLTIGSSDTKVEIGNMWARDYDITGPTASFVAPITG